MLLNHLGCILHKPSSIASTYFHMNQTSMSSKYEELIKIRDLAQDGRECCHNSSSPRTKGDGGKGAYTDSEGALQRISVNFLISKGSV